MATVTDNEIRSEMMLRASIDKVWDALTTHEGWTGWFSYGVVGKFEEGETLTLDFGPYGECFAMVSTVNPKTEFAYKWHPGEDCPIEKYPESELTTVRFTLEALGDGTQNFRRLSGSLRMTNDSQRPSLTFIENVIFRLRFKGFGMQLQR